MINKPLYVYDLETYRNCFLFIGKWYRQPGVHVFEISFRRNMKSELLNYLSYLKNLDAHMIGYNSLPFDCPIIQDLMSNPILFDETRAYELGQKIIEKNNSVIRFGQRPSLIPLKDRIIHQIDLMKMWHYDNKTKSTRLKDLEFAMRSQTVQDLPYDVHTPLSSEQMDHLVAYGIHDVLETEKFAIFSEDRIKLRADLVQSRAIKGDVFNWNDTKLGEMYFINKLGCGRVKGTDRLTVNFSDVILPHIQFRHPEFQEVLETFKTKRWVKGDEDANKLIPFKRTIAGIELGFGSGGLHGSVENKIYHESETHKIIDIDVSGMYPAVGIANGFYPEHLGPKFVDVYRQLKFDRKQHKKGTALNSVLKLAQNGVYGKSNSEFSAVFDVKYLFSITINGQLFNLLLFEMLRSIPGIQFIQDNTDGITMYVPRVYEWMFNQIKLDWEKNTQLELEQVEYKSMFVRDVNNYVAVKKDNSVKRIGAYWFAESWADYDAGPGKWHMDHSMMVVPKVAEICMLNPKLNPEFVLKTMSDPFDFMLRQKVQGGQKCFIGKNRTQKTVRYYISKAGEPMKIIRPAPGPVGMYKRKNKITDKLYTEVLREVGTQWDARIHVGKANQPKTQTTYQDTVSNIASGYLVRDCCDAADFNWADVDYAFYLAEVNKLIIKG